MKRDLSYRSTIIFPDKSKSGILWVAHEIWGPTFNVTRVFTNKYFIALVKSGSGKLKDGKHTAYLNEGSFFILGNSIKSYYFEPAEEGLEMLIVACLSDPYEKFIKKHIPVKTFSFQPRNLSEISFIFEQLYSYAREKSYFFQDICGHFLHSMLLMLHKGFIDDITLKDKSEITYQSIKNYLDRNYVSIRYVQDVAARFEVSVEYISRLFCKYDTITPHRYLGSLKMRKAGEMIMSTKQPIKEIAFELGYPDQYVFSKAFKKIMGVSPERYRKEGEN